MASPVPPVRSYDRAIDAFWAAVRLTATAEDGAGPCSAAPDRGVEPPVRSLPITAMPERSTARAGTSASKASVTVPAARSTAASSRVGAPLPAGAAATARPVGGSRLPPDGLPAASENAPGADSAMRTLPPVSLCSARAAAAWAGASRISSIAEGSIDENDAPARGTGVPAWPDSDKSPVRAPCGRTCSSNSSVTVPRSRSSAACGEEGDRAASLGPAPSADASASSPRAAGIALPDRSDTAPRARSTATDAPGSPPCASSAAWTAAFCAPVSTT